MNEYDILKSRIKNREYSKARFYDIIGDLKRRRRINKTQYIELITMVNAMEEREFKVNLIEEREFNNCGTIKVEYMGTIYNLNWKLEDGEIKIREMNVPDEVVRFVTTKAA